MLDKNKEQKHIDMDNRSNPIMTLRTVKYYCEKEGLFSAPEHNDKLYLQYKGFTKIIPETISQYHNLVALWLNNNSISKIEGLNQLINLTSLALNNNFICKMEGLQNLINLSILNLSHNKIQYVQGLDQLRKLKTINLSKNFIVHPHALTGLHFCQNLTSIDLSQNQIQNCEETFSQIAKNKHVSCLYLKATPLSRGFRNYRKKFIAALKKLKFLDDRPVLQKDHRLSEAWLQGGVEQQQTQKVRMAQEKQRKEEQQNLFKAQFQHQQASQRQKPEGYIADIKDTSIRIMNIEDSQEQQRIINKYFQNEKEQIEKNLRRQKEQEQKELANMEYYKSHETEVIAAKVRQIFGQEKQDQDEKNRSEKKIQQKWKDKYQKILQTLLLRYKFDFSQVQPSFNMIIATVNKKLLRSPVRFQILELRKIWTKIELRRRQESKH